MHTAVLPATEQPGLSECFVVHVETFDLYTLQEIAYDAYIVQYIVTYLPNSLS